MLPQPLPHAAAVHMEKALYAARILIPQGQPHKGGGPLYPHTLQKDCLARNVCQKSITFKGQDKNIGSVGKPEHS